MMFYGKVSQLLNCNKLHLESVKHDESRYQTLLTHYILRATLPEKHHEIFSQHNSYMPQFAFILKNDAHISQLTSTQEQSSRVLPVIGRFNPPVPPSSLIVPEILYNHRSNQCHNCSQNPTT